MFRILVVDDNPGTLFLMQKACQSMRNQPELYFAKDGMDALDFLYRRGIHENAPRPSLITLDLVDALTERRGETCSLIKAGRRSEGDSDYYVIHFGSPGTT